jgi:hypothetical protein
MNVNVSISLDESLLDGVHEKLDVIMEAQTTIISMLMGVSSAQAINQATDEMEVAAMSDVSDRIVRGLEEVRDLRTVTDGIVTWSQTMTTALSDVRAQLAAKGVTDEDLAGLDEMISTTDSQTGRLAQVLTEGTDAEEEEPVNPVPPVVDVPPAPTTGGDATDPSTAPDV